MCTHPPPLSPAHVLLSVPVVWSQQQRKQTDCSDGPRRLSTTGTSMAAAHHTSAILCASKTVVELVPDLKLNRLASCQAVLGTIVIMILSYEPSILLHVQTHACDL